MEKAAHHEARPLLSEGPGIGVSSGFEKLDCKEDGRSEAPPKAGDSSPGDALSIILAAHAGKLCEYVINLLGGGFGGYDHLKGDLENGPHLSPCF